MDQQHPAPPAETPTASGFQPPAPAQEFTVASAADPDLVKRGVALLIDSLIIGCAYGILTTVLTLAVGWLGGFVAAAAAAVAVLVRDVALDGRSPGKKVIGLAAVGNDGAPVTLQQSVMRNSTLAVGYANSALASIPLLGLLAIPLGLVALLIGCYEIYLVATRQPRLGDRLAGTHVVFQGQPVIAL